MPFEIPEREISLYHGTTREHGGTYEIDLSGRRPDTDFGRGYYLTSIPFQAEDWAKRNGRPGAKGWVYEYVFQLPPGFPVLLLPEYDRQWLDVITCHRLRASEPVQDSDIVIGGMADRATRDELVKILERYRDGKLTASDALRQITPKRAWDQYCFKTPEAIRLLRPGRVWKWRCTNERARRWIWTEG